MKSKDSNSKKSVSYQKKDGRGHDKDLKVNFLVTHLILWPLREYLGYSLQDDLCMTWFSQTKPCKLYHFQDQYLLPSQWIIELPTWL